MSAKDAFHQVVKVALQNEGWNITADPLEIRWGAVEMYIDLGAEKVIGAERNGEKIAVEVKSFLGQSAIYEFHLALGQFINYRAVLQQQEAERTLYLAVPLDTYDTFFKLPFTQEIVQQNQMKLLVYDINREVIVKWKS
ncbi:XisH family protein [Pseudanabaena sp. PCC 6802]|uniref:XisH family protein n=1 Tax=Pseudanabaena sp. PCC 6802 TaxID=118173 RepID=UPI0003497AEF|nr:XisH family protein [Pseudanabaena sp. PCC 6802]